MSIVNLQKLEERWNNQIKGSRKELLKMGITKEPLRIIIDIMNSYKRDSMKILSNIENDYVESLVTGNLAKKICMKIDDHVLKKKIPLNSEDFLKYEKEAREELKKQFKSAKKKKLSKYRK